VVPSLLMVRTKAKRRGVTRRATAFQNSNDEVQPGGIERIDRLCGGRPAETSPVESSLMRWTIHGERTLYRSHWLSFGLVDIELPTGRRFEHEVVRAPTAAVGTIVYVEGRGVLLLRRHRFITDGEGWEIPAGRVDPGEDTATAAAREVLEETGWRPTTVSPLFRYHPDSGVSDQVFHVFFADQATEVGPPVDWYESDAVRWVPLSTIRKELAEGTISDGMTIAAFSWACAFGPLAGSSDVEVQLNSGNDPGSL
jgi:8-oxo-dGTP pyrophosphatase MutT (NUDIX family)